MSWGKMHLAENLDLAIVLEAWWENLLTYHLYFTFGGLARLSEHSVDLRVVSSEESFECHLSHHKRVNHLLLLMLLIILCSCFREL